MPNLYHKRLFPVAAIYSLWVPKCFLVAVDCISAGIWNIGNHVTVCLNTYAERLPSIQNSRMGVTVYRRLLTFSQQKTLGFRKRILTQEGSACTLLKGHFLRIWLQTKIGLLKRSFIRGQIGVRQPDNRKTSAFYFEGLAIYKWKMFHIFLQVDMKTKDHHGSYLQIWLRC